MLTWGELTETRPDLAAFGRRMLYGHGLGLAFLATTRADGGPRVHPICPVLTDAGMYAFVVPGPKLADLRRDARFALHSETFPPPRHDDAFYLTGCVRELDAPELRGALTRQLLAERSMEQPWPGFEAQPLVEFLVAGCLLTLTEAEDGVPAGHTIWRA